MAEDIISWPSFKALEALPLLNAFLKEVLRLWPTVPGPLERSVAKGGAVIHDIFLPEAAEVTMQAYTLHRNVDVFPEPSLFKPERWLNEIETHRGQGRGLLFNDLRT